MSKILKSHFKKEFPIYGINKTGQKTQKVQHNSNAKTSY